MWTSNASGAVTGGKALTGIDLYSAETTLNMDLTGDGVIGSSAKLTGNLQLDMNNLDLSRLISYSYQSNSYNNISYNGKSYKDVLEVDWKYNGNYYSSIFGGYDLTYYTDAQNYKIITSGIVTGYLELYWNGSQWINSWGLENINISATEIFNDAITISTVDDYSTFQKILTGNDNIIGSPYNDTLFGGLGSDTFNGGGGSDIFYIKNNESLISSFDVINDFNYNDSLKIGRTVAAGAFISKSIVGTGSLENDLASSLAGQALNFIQSSAALIAITGSNSDAGTYAVIANHTNSNPGFVAATDTVIKLQNYQQGSLNAYSFIF
jgi:Ca2+-binding RTX toxin-like protein